MPLPGETPDAREMALSMRLKILSLAGREAVEDT
jgi:hypothetical protein